MKRWKKIVIGVVIVLVVLIVAVNIFAGRMVKGAINTIGPKALGVPVSVQDVKVGFLRGQFGLSGMVIGNPEGFKTPEAIRLGKVSVKVNMASLFSKVLIIESIYIGGPEVTYEIGLKGSNIGAIQEKVAPSKAGEDKPKPAEAPAAAGKKVQINDFLMESGKIYVSSVGMAGQKIKIPLPTIHLKDIGKESEGASVKEVIAKVFSAIGGAVSGAAGGIGKGVEALGENAVKAGKTIGDSAKNAGKAVGESASKTLESIGGLLKKK